MYRRRARTVIHSNRISRSMRPLPRVLHVQILYMYCADVTLVNFLKGIYRYILILILNGYFLLHGWWRSPADAHTTPSGTGPSACFESTGTCIDCAVLSTTI